MRILPVLFSFFLIQFISSPVYATEENAEKTGKSCVQCHFDSSGGGELTKEGKEYLVQLLDETDPGKKDIFQQRQKGLSHYFRFAVGFLHIFVAIFWFGTILYVHIILRPAYAAHGLPKGEVRLGLISMLIMAITGIVLTMYRIPTWQILYETRFGILLMIKIALYVIMASTALFVVIFLGPKLKAGAHQKTLGNTSEISADDLRGFMGENGGPTYFIYKDNIYDASQSKLWKDGMHFGRHKAGEDLTDKLRQAPHDEDKIFELPLVGKQIPPQENKRTPHERMFFFIAYTELGFVILIILILALWKWW
jgi:predicted heme/steroid binding protein